MKVAIDSGPLTSGHAVRGVGAYTRNLTQALQSLEKRTKGFHINSFDFEKDAKLLHTDYDIIHIPDFKPYFRTLPWHKPPGKLVVTVHDLIPLIYPDHYVPGVKGSIRFMIQKYLFPTIDGVIAVTETTKKDIVRFLGYPPEKIYVTHLGPNPNARKIEKTRLGRIKEKYNLPPKFVLYVGDINYNKNIPRLIRACKLAEVPLVICGKQASEIDQLLSIQMQGPMDVFRKLRGKNHPEHSHLTEIANEIKNNSEVHTLGFVPEEDLYAIFNLATLYCQPSLYEGFGMSLLDAMACGTPLVVGKTQALVEVADKAAIYFEPKNEGEIAQIIRRVFDNPPLRASLAREGFRHLKNFSWDFTALGTVAAYRKIMGYD